MSQRDFHPASFWRFQDHCAWSLIYHPFWCCWVSLHVHPPPYYILLVYHSTACRCWPEKEATAALIEFQGFHCNTLPSPSSKQVMTWKNTSNLATKVNQHFIVGHMIDQPIKTATFTTAHPHII